MAGAADGAFEFSLADGSPVALEWLTDEMAVEPAPGVTPEALRQALQPPVQAGVVRQAPADAGNRLLTLDLGSSLTAAAWHGRATELTAQAPIRQVYPVFAHGPLGHRAILTDEVIVHVKDEVPLDKLAAINKGHPFRVVDRLPGDPRTLCLRLERPTAFAALEFANALAASGNVVWAEPNFVIELRRAFVPNDPDFPRQWQLHNTGQSAGIADADLDAPEAWDVTRGNPGVVIAILDDGMDIDHSDLRANIFVNPAEIAGNNLDDDRNGYIDDVKGWDFLMGDNSPRPESAADYHATPCAGLVAATAGNAVGVSGIAPGCRILPCRILGATNPTILQVAKAIQYAEALADVLSMSWTTLPNSTMESDFQHAAAAGRSGRGCVLVAAVGNESQSTAVGFPASLDFVLGLGASTRYDTRISYSNYSAGSDVFALAPGDGTYTTLVSSRYGAFSGTSAAAPLAAGAAALVLSRMPGLTRTQVATVLSRSADKVDSTAANYDASGYSHAYGYGRINAHRALMELASDLVPEGFDFAPERVEEGARLTFSGRVRNVAQAPSAECWLEFWLSNDPDFATLNHLACLSVRLPALPAGGEFRLDSLVRDLAADVPDGLFRLGIVIDRLHEVHEVNEGNNTAYQAVRFLEVGAGSTSVDLAIEDFDFAPAQVLGDDAIAFAGRVINRGVQMSRPVWLEFWLSSDPAGRTLERVACTSVLLDPLGPGDAFDLAALQRTIERTGQAIPDGRYRFGAVVDRPGSQADLNRANNTTFRLDKWLTVGRPSAARLWSHYR